MVYYTTNGNKKLTTWLKPVGFMSWELNEANKMAEPKGKIRVGNVSATVWENEGENGKYNTVSIDKNYKDKEGNWKSTNSYNVNELYDLITAAQATLNDLKVKKE